MDFTKWLKQGMVLSKTADNFVIRSFKYDNENEIYVFVDGLPLKYCHFISLLSMSFMYIYLENHILKNLNDEIIQLWLNADVDMNVYSSNYMFGDNMTLDNHLSHKLPNNLSCDKSCDNQFKAQTKRNNLDFYRILILITRVIKKVASHNTTAADPISIVKEIVLVIEKMYKPVWEVNRVL